MIMVQKITLAAYALHDGERCRAALPLLWWLLTTLAIRQGSERV